MTATATHPQELVSTIASNVREHPNKSLALYVHIPFCASKCHFCDWVVDIPVRRLRSGPEQRAAYVDALCSQIRFYGPQLTRVGYRPQVMYWGGGTPTRLEPPEMLEIKQALADSFDLSGLEQWSMETTPNDLTDTKLATMRAIGVDRVSVGVQSFHPDQLRRSGRAHSPAQALEAVATLRRGGIHNFNLDLIAGFPGEPLQSLRESLEQAVALAAPHISVYPYRATQKTVMAMRLEHTIGEAMTRPRMLEAYELAMEILVAAGYHEYCHGYWVQAAEHEDRDGNYKYDLSGDKLGLGSGAESIIGHHLLWNENARFEDYMRNPLGFTFARRFSLDDPARLTAPIGGALMTREGVVFDRFERLTGIPFAAARDTPYMRKFLALLAECGATFVETDRSLRIDAGTIHGAYITHLLYTTATGMAPQRA